MHELKAELIVLGQLDMTTLALCMLPLSTVGYLCQLLIKFAYDTSGGKNRREAAGRWPRSEWADCSSPRPCPHEAKHKQEGRGRRRRVCDEYAGVVRVYLGMQPEPVSTAQNPSFWLGPSSAQPEGHWAQAGMTRGCRPCLGRTLGPQASTARPAK